jgi:alpha-1,3/alpha-1,6-mannosyltransferase
MRVAFIHPDLGIGGAEQLVINLALACRNLGWYVKIFTPSYDPTRAFEQTKDGTLDVEVRGNIFPRRIFGRMHALCEYVRMLCAAIYLILFGGDFDLVIVDQIPLPVPLLNIRFKTFFYCHFPDKLLCVERSSLLKKIYRFFIDLIEEITMLFAKIIVVNSKYTQGVFEDNFKIISMFRSPPSVIYPCIELKDYDRFEQVLKEDLLKVKGLERLKNYNLNNLKIIVSLNRYERKKNLNLATEAYIEFMNNLKGEKDYILIIAGGYDVSLRENIEVCDTLKSYDYKDFKDKVFFLHNISNEERCILLKTANIVLYTPKNEHFGIVPVESMYCGSFVIAHKSGGPIESVNNGLTGYLIDNEEPRQWALKIEEFFNSDNLNNQTKMNKESLKNILKQHVLDNFSLKSMKDDFASIVFSKCIKSIKNY